MTTNIVLDNKIESISEMLSKQVKKCAKTAVKLLKIKHSIIEISFILVSDEKMKELNKQTRKIDTTTDVLSFPLLNLKMGDKISKKLFPTDFNKTSKTINLGDIYINTKKAKLQAKEFHHTFEREICYLAVHGVLHLLGFDHENETDKKIMRAVEELVLDKNNIVR